MTYFLFNLALIFLLGVPSLFFAPKKRQLLISFKVASFVTLIGIPWDFWAIKQGIWAYPAPGPMFMSIPANDILFMFTCSFVAAQILIGAWSRSPLRKNPTEAK